MGRKKNTFKDMKEDNEGYSQTFLSHLVCSELLKVYIGRRYKEEGAMDSENPYLLV